MRKWLIDLRQKANMTQGELADRVHITIQLYHCIENGDIMPTPRIAKRITAVLGVPNEWIRLLYDE